MFHYFFIDTSRDTLSDKNKQTEQKIRQYFTFNMGKSYTFVDVQGTNEGGRE